MDNKLSSNKKNETLAKNAENSENKINKKFFTGKNIAIIILSFILFLSIINYPNTSELDNTINDLNSKIAEQDNQISIYSEKLEKINSENQEKINKLKEENETLQKEKNELIEKNETLTNENNQLKSSNQNTTSNNNTTYTSVAKQTSTQTNNTTQMVWIGDTGTKYHLQSCRTLKGKGHQITYQQAIAEGREACKVCH